MVKLPVVAALAVALPDTIPKRALATTAILAGPPVNRPNMAVERSMKMVPPPIFIIMLPHITRMNRVPTATVVGIPGRVVAVRNPDTDTVERLPDPVGEKFELLEKRITELEKRLAIAEGRKR